MTAETQAEKDHRPFPIQGPSTHRTIPWWLAEEAYAVYSSEYGTQQSLEELARRGGFGAGELDMFIPGWRERLDRVTQLEAQVAALSTRLAVAEEELAKAQADVERMDMLEDWFSNGRDLVIQHDEPDHSDHVREREVTVYDKQGRYPWQLSVLLVKNAYGEDDRRNEWIRDALDAARRSLPTR